MIALVRVKFNDKLVLRGLKVLVGPTNVSSVICWTINGLWTVTLSFNVDRVVMSQKWVTKYFSAKEGKQQQK